MGSTRPHVLYQKIFAWGYYLIWKIEKKVQFGFDKNRIIVQDFECENNILLPCAMFKSFCLREWGRLGNGGRPILLKFGTLSYYEDLCNMSKFQLHCPYFG